MRGGAGRMETGASGHIFRPVCYVAPVNCPICKHPFIDASQPTGASSAVLLELRWAEAHREQVLEQDHREVRIRQ